MNYFVKIKILELCHKPLVFRFHVSVQSSGPLQHLLGNTFLLSHPIYVTFDEQGTGSFSSIGRLLSVDG